MDQEGGEKVFPFDQFTKTSLHPSIDLLLRFTGVRIVRRLPSSSERERNPCYEARESAAIPERPITASQLAAHRPTVTVATLRFMSSIYPKEVYGLGGARS